MTQKNWAITHGEYAGHPQVKLFSKDHRAHWERWGKGQLTLEINACPLNPNGNGQWLQIITREHGTKSYRETYATLDTPETIRALRDACNVALGEK